MSGTSILHNLARPGAAPGEGVRWLGDPEARSRITILNGHAETWAARSGGGAWSVKWAPLGTVAYRCEGDTHLVRPDGLMLLNGVAFADQIHRVAPMADHDLWMTFFNDPDDHVLALMMEAPKGWAPSSSPHP